MIFLGGPMSLARSFREMSSISPFSSNIEAIFAAKHAPASAPSASTSGAESTPQDTVHINHPEAREVFQLGRVSYNEQAGNLTSAQGAQLDSQIQQTQATITSDTQGSDGTLTAAEDQSIRQLQNGVSAQIYTEANPTKSEN
jgi:hypothetical protein